MSRIEAADGPQGRMVAAWDYLRAVLAGMPEDDVTDIADGVTTDLVRAADSAQAQGGLR